MFIMILLFYHLEILFDIHDLAKHIQKGNGERVDELIKILIKKGVKLQVEESKKLSNETDFRYVKINFCSFLSLSLFYGIEFEFKLTVLIRK